MKHGGDLSDAIALHGGPVEDWLDLSTGVNPQPWPIGFDLWMNALHRLPARTDEEALISAARGAYKVPDSVAVVAAPGTQALIQWLPHLAPAGNAAILGPTYSEHARSWQRAGRTVIAADGLKALPQDVRCLVAVNPNNPDGHIFDSARFTQAADEMRSRGGWLIVDESFADIDPSIGCAGLCADLPIVVLRSFGKFFGLPGLRLGFLIAAPRIASLFHAALGPWAVAAPALLIGAAALRDQAWAESARLQLEAMTHRLDSVLARAGFRLIGGTSLFRFVQHTDAQALHKKLAERHIWCRVFDEFPDRLRFGLPRNDEELVRLQEAIIHA